jgi:hypothetical protein
MIEKMSKSNSVTPNIDETDTIKMLESKIKGLESEVKYWKLRYELLKKYGNVSN